MGPKNLDFFFTRLFNILRCSLVFGRAQLGKQCGSVLLHFLLQIGTEPGKGGKVDLKMMLGQCSPREGVFQPGIAFERS